MLLDFIIYCSWLHTCCSYCCSVAKLCQTLCNDGSCSPSGSSVLHYLLEFAQIHVLESVMLSNHLILCCPLLFLPSVLPSIRIFSNKLPFCNRWPKYWSFSFSIGPSNDYSGLISFKMDGWISLLSKGLSRVFSDTIVQKYQFFSAQLTSIHDYWKNHSFD